MASRFNKISLGKLQKLGLADIQTGPFGTVLKASEFSDFGVPVISTGEIREGFVQLSQRTPFVSEEITNRLPQFVLELDDIVFGRKGAIDRNAIIKGNQVGWFLGSDGIRLRLSKDINSAFVSYQLRLDAIGKWLLQNSTGSTMPSLNQKILDRLPLWLPPICIQDGIASILSSIDAKIEVNNKINAELEAMAKLIYDYWFVQFDFPFDLAQGKPDPNGKPYKSSGGKMVYNAALKREIPEGWEVGTLLDIANYQNGIACQKFRPIDETYLPVIKIKEMRDGYTDKTEKVRLDVPDRVKIFDGDVLFSWSASLEVIIWSGGKGALNQHIFKVTSDNYPKSYYYFELLNYLQHFKMIADLRKTTMGHITQDHLKQSRISIPPYDLCFRLEEKIGPMLKSIVSNRQQNQKLSEQRDWLLPMLMNGQVTVANEELGITNAELGNDLGMVAEETQEYKYTK